MPANSSKRVEIFSKFYGVYKMRISIFSPIFMYLELFVFELQQNNKIATWEIEWISNVVKIWTSNAHKNLMWFSCRDIFID